MWLPLRHLWMRIAPARRAANVRVVLYTRQGCHLCETAWEQLEQAQRRYHFELAAVDVDTDPELVGLYGEQVPVVTVNDKVRFRGSVNVVLLQRLLRAQ